MHRPGSAHAHVRAHVHIHVQVCAASDEHFDRALARCVPCEDTSVVWLRLWLVAGSWVGTSQSRISCMTPFARTLSCSVARAAPTCRTFL